MLLLIVRLLVRLLTNISFFNPGKWPNSHGQNRDRSLRGRVDLHRSVSVVHHLLDARISGGDELKHTAAASAVVEMRDGSERCRSNRLLIPFVASRLPWIATELPNGFFLFVAILYFYALVHHII